MPTSPSLAPARLLLGALLRGLVLMGIGYAVLLLIEALSGPSVGANIGAGIAALLAPPIVAVVWAFVDGRAHGWGALWLWVSAAAVAGVAEALRQGDAGGFAFIAVATGVAAVVGVALGVAVAGSGQRATRSG